MARRRAEVPHDRLVSLGEEAEAVELVGGPGSDMGGSDVTDVAHVKAQQGAEFGLGQQGLDAGQALLAQAVVADPLLPVDAHHAIAMQAHRPALRSCKRLHEQYAPEPQRTTGARVTCASAMWPGRRALVVMGVVVVCGCALLPVGTATARGGACARVLAG